MPLTFRCRPALLGSVVVSALAGAAAAGEPQYALGVDVTLGYDSNPLRINDAGTEQGGAFSEVALDAGVRVPLSRGLEWYLEGRAATRLHDSTTSDGDRDDGDLTLGFEITPNPRSSRRVVLRVGASHALSRSVFTDRTSGRVYEVESEPPTVPATFVPIPRRFDVDTTSAFVEARWRVHRRLRMSLAARLDDARYVEDYTDGTGLLPLDYGAVSLRPALRWQIGARTVLGFDATVTELDYEAQPALDGNGQQVPGTLREYRYTSYGLTLRLVPAPRWRLRFGVVDGSRADTHAGYYDFGSLAGFVSIDHRPGRRSRIQLYASLRDLDYDVAVVPGSVNGEIRGNEINRLVSRYDRTFGRHFGWFAVAGAQRTVSADPVFSYDRDWLETGFRYRL